MLIVSLTGPIPAVGPFAFPSHRLSHAVAQFTFGLACRDQQVKLRNSQRRTPSEVAQDPEIVLCDVMPKGPRAIVTKSKQDPPHSNVKEGVKIIDVDT